MNVKSRLIALKLLEKQQKHPEYAKQIGFEVDVVIRHENESMCEHISINKEE